jgi:hypothetical protein
MIKFRFGCKVVDYLEQLISEVVKVDLVKIEAMIKWPFPKTLKPLGVFRFAWILQENY